MNTLLIDNKGNVGLPEQIERTQLTVEEIVEMVNTPVHGNCCPACRAENAKLRHELIEIKSRLKKVEQPVVLE